MLKVCYLKFVTFFQKGKSMSEHIGGHTSRLPSHCRVFWDWDIHYSCNYRCSYCFLTEKRERAAQENRYPGTAKWIAVWNRIHEKYGSCHIHFDY